MTTDNITLEGWRVFGLGEDGELVPPFLARYWPDKATPADHWQPGVNTARCLFNSHPAPAAGCFCGLRLVQDRAELLGNVAADYFVGSTRTIIEETGVVAKVRGTGRAMAGCDMPVDDPNTTVRVERLELVEVYLPTGKMAHAAALTARYGVPVLPAGAWWPAARLPRPAPPKPGRESFLAQLRIAGFGTGDVHNPEQAEAWMEVGEDIAKLLREGVPAEELIRGLFDCDKRPTAAQAEAVLMAAYFTLAPDAHVMRGWVWSKPLTMLDAIGRQAETALRPLMQQRSR